QAYDMETPKRSTSYGRGLALERECGAVLEVLKREVLPECQAGGAAPQRSGFRQADLPADLPRQAAGEPRPGKSADRGGQPGGTASGSASPSLATGNVSSAPAAAGTA